MLVIRVDPIIMKGTATGIYGANPPVYHPTPSIQILSSSRRLSQLHLPNQTLQNEDHGTHYGEHHRIKRNPSHRFFPSKFKSDPTSVVIYESQS
jgi:hypothetical protein